MDALWWFYTIVLGLAFAQISLAIAVILRHRAESRERIHLPTLLWLVFLLLLTIEVWIAVGTYQRSQESMSVLSLLAFLWVPMGVLILTTFLADPTWSKATPDQNDVRFAKVRTSFFLVLLMIPVVNMLHELALGSLGVDVDLLFPALIALGAILGFFIRRTRADSLLAAAMVIVIGIYLFAYYGTVSAA